MSIRGKKFLLTLMLFVFTSIGVCFADTPIYERIGKNVAELLTEYGEPGQLTLVKNDDSLFVYKTELGYQSFLVHNKIVRSINTTSYWKTKSKVKSAFEYTIKLYQADGFTITKKTKTAVTIVNEKYSVIIETSVMEGWYQVSKTIIEIKKQ